MGATAARRAVGLSTVSIVFIVCLPRRSGVAGAALREEDRSVEQICQADLFNGSTGRIYWMASPRPVAASGCSAYPPTDLVEPRSSKSCSTRPVELSLRDSRPGAVAVAQAGE